MLNIDVLNSFLKEIFINLLIFYVFVKITNYGKVSKKDKIIVLFCCILTAILYAELLIYFEFSIVNIICLIIYMIVIAYVTKNEISYTFVITILSTAITFGTFFLSTLISASILKPFLYNLNNSPIGICIISGLEAILIYIFFHIKRFKKRLFIH